MHYTTMSDIELSDNSNVDWDSLDDANADESNIGDSSKMDQTEMLAKSLATHGIAMRYDNCEIVDWFNTDGERPLPPDPNVPALKPRRYPRFKYYPRNR